MPDAGEPAHTPRTTPTDARLEAFADFLEAVDRNDWKAGLITTRALRARGISVCLCKPTGDRGTA